MFSTHALRAFALVVGLSGAAVHAAEPGRGATADFEVAYLRAIIDHHFGALRMTELAAGTLDAVVGDIASDDRTRPTPGFAATDPRAAADEVKSLARRNNRAQREEILTAQRFLRDWYGIMHQPQIDPATQADIERLTAPEGKAFDALFLQLFSVHHYMAATSSLDCLLARELRHDDLRRYCRSIVEAQVLDVDEMRHLLCRDHDICDFQPQRQAMNRAVRR